MLTAEGCSARRQRLWDALSDKPDWVLIADPAGLMYFANFWASPFVFRSAEAPAMLLMSRDGRSVLVADNVQSAFAEKAFVDERVTPAWYRGTESAPHRGGLMVRAALERLARSPGVAFGIGASSVPAGVIEGLRSQWSGVRFLDVDDVVRRLRRAKDADEVDLLLRTMRAAEAGQAAAMRGITPGMSELDAFRLIQSASVQAAGEPAWVYGDFASGAEPRGGGPGNRVIAAGDLFLLDYSVVLYHYRCDFANTFVVGGKPTDRQRELSAACLQAMAAGEKLLQPGTPCAEIDRAVRAVFESRGLGGTFPHHTGHGLGLGHPEPPYLVPQSTDTLIVGDVVTIEPGQYVPGVGGMRFERNYLITAGGYEVLSRHTIGLQG